MQLWGPPTGCTAERDVSWTVHKKQYSRTVRLPKKITFLNSIVVAASIPKSPTYRASLPANSAGTMCTCCTGESVFVVIFAVAFNSWIWCALQHWLVRDLQCQQARALGPSLRRTAVSCSRSTTVRTLCAGTLCCQRLTGPCMAMAGPQHCKLQVRCAIDAAILRRLC
jgi:hypothetical protein